MHGAKHGATRRFSTLSPIISLMMVFALMAIAPLAGAAREEKIDVCRCDADSDLFHVINIGGNAFDKHVAHGDGDPDSWVNGGPTGGDGLTEATRSALSLPGSFAEVGTE